MLVIGVRKVPVPDVNEKREELSAIFIQIGLKRNVAKVLTYLSEVEEATSREIEMGSDLRQPEVSIAMREMRELDWISERDEKSPGKGRPYRIYKLNKSMSDIISYLEMKKREESKQAISQIQRLKSLKK